MRFRSVSPATSTGSWRPVSLTWGFVACSPVDVYRPQSATSVAKRSAAAFGDDVDRGAVGDEKRGVGVAQVVDLDAWQLAAADDAVEALADRFGVEEPAGGVAEHPVVGPARQPIASELSSPPSKLVQGGAVDLDASAAGARLGCELDGAAADVLQGA